MVSPCWTRLMPHPASDPAGAPHHKSWKLLASRTSPGPPDAHVGDGTNNSRVIGLVWVMPLTVYANHPLLESLKVSVPMPTAVPVAPPGLPMGGNGIASNAGPVAA